jgi:hypothetical protein
MIHLITAANRCLFEDELLELHRIDCANSAHAMAWKAGGPANIGHFDDDDMILPERVGREWVRAVLIPIDASKLEATRAFYGIDESVLVHHVPRPSITWEITS